MRAPLLRSHAARAAAMFVAAMFAAACSGSGGDATTAVATTAAPTPIASPLAPTSTAQTSDPTPASLAVEVAAAVEGGSARLSLPVGALPEGVDPASVVLRDVTAERQTAAAADTAAAEAATPLAVFELLPDGLVLAQSAALEIALPLEQMEGALFVTHATADGFASVGDLTVEIDEEAGTLTLAATLDHFSVFSVEIGWLFIVDITATPLSALVGERITITAVTRRGGRTVTAGVGTAYRYDWRIKPAPWSLRGSWSAFGLTPGTLYQQPPNTNVSGDCFTVVQRFVCATAGNVFVTYIADVRFVAVPSISTALRAGSNLPPEIRTSGRAVGLVQVTCLAGPTPTPEPSPTLPPLPSPTPTPTPTPIPDVSNQPPTVSKITAQYVPYTSTKYFVTSTDPEGDPLTAKWDAVPCGTVNIVDLGGGTFAMTWNHAHPPCPEGNHDDVIVRVVVTDGHWDVVCTHKGTEFGISTACVSTPRP